ncbi:MAG: sigma-70 family RNA polymerase sigma factor, partial [Candidatus Brocadiae bacterium]|nr:sigma-70 family RNA polymerase sigma factor [Candidatus Brocadiia bacterium]
DDACQETFVQAWRQLGTLRDPAALGPWLLAIARNLALDRLRSRKRDGRREELHEDAAAARPIANDRELRERTMAHIRALPESYRETLVLRLVEGLDGPEIAAQTGLTPGSVRVNLSRGMELLRERLRKDGWP